MPFLPVGCSFSGRNETAAPRRISGPGHHIRWRLRSRLAGRQPGVQGPLRARFPAMLADPGCQDVPLRCLSTTVMAPLVLATVVASGCAEGPQVAVAWRAGAAAWPENSRTALKRLPPGVPVHVDAFLAFDRQPVLNALPYLDESRCETLAGQSHRRTRVAASRGAGLAASGLAVWGRGSCVPRCRDGA